MTDYSFLFCIYIQSYVYTLLIYNRESTNAPDKFHKAMLYARQSIALHLVKHSFTKNNSNRR